MTPEEYIKAVCKTESVDFDAISKRLQNPETIRLLHGAMGLVTEAGEFMDALKKHIFYGKDLDGVNLNEELGDLLWYVSILIDTLGRPMESIMERNIAKLKARYGDKFSETRAEDRDLEKEREILEGEEDPLREKLAAFMHEVWSGWMEYLFSPKNCEFVEVGDGKKRADIGSWAVSRWQRQMKTSYEDLPEEEKQSDRELADKLLEILEKQRK